MDKHEDRDRTARPALRVGNFHEIASAEDMQDWFDGLAAALAGTAHELGVNHATGISCKDFGELTARMVAGLLAIRRIDPFPTEETPQKGDDGKLVVIPALAEITRLREQLQEHFDLEVDTGTVASLLMVLGREGYLSFGEPARLQPAAGATPASPKEN
jgi:hypothetical protein